MIVFRIYDHHSIPPVRMIKIQALGTCSDSLNQCGKERLENGTKSTQQMSRLATGAQLLS